jgi:hypothetical protein
VVPADDLDRIIMKIGSTAKTGQERMKEISSQCKHYSMKREVVPEGWLIPNYKRAERLIQAHLRDRLSAFACGCRKPHREYFDVETATALEVMRFWTAFCESNPYDAAGKLRPFWKYRLRQRKKLPYWGHQAPEGLSELESRRRRWEVFANPTRIEIYWFHAMVAWSKYWPWKVHLFAVFEAYVIVYLVLPKLYFFLVLSLTIAIWALW